MPGIILLLSIDPGPEIYLLTLASIILFFILKPCTSFALFGGLLIAPWFLVFFGGHLGGLFAIISFFIFTIPFLLLALFLSFVTNEFKKDNNSKIEPFPDTNEQLIITQNIEENTHATEERE